MTAASKCSGHKRSRSSDTAIGALGYGHHGKLRYQDHPHQRNNMWRAGCGESRTSGSEGGPEKPTRHKTRAGASVRPYTYIPMQRGFQYLVAIMDWATRTVLSWRLSNTLDSDFCTEALEDALAQYGRPEIFNTDQGCQFTSQDFTQVLDHAGVRISMDGKGRWMDNIFIERLWRSLKYECVYLHDFQDGHQARQTIGTWLTYYNEERIAGRPHLLRSGRRQLPSRSPQGLPQQELHLGIDAAQVIASPRFQCGVDPRIEP